MLLLLKHPPQGRAADAQTLCCRALVSVAFCQHLPDDMPVYLVEGVVGIDAKSAGMPAVCAAICSIGSGSNPII